MIMTQNDIPQAGTVSLTTGSCALPLPLLKKKDIIQRLYNQGHISFDEMWVLVNDKDPDYAPPYIPDTPQFPPYQPLPPWPYPTWSPTTGNPLPPSPTNICRPEETPKDNL